MAEYVLALDQGTTSSRAIIFDSAGRPVGAASREFRQIFPKPGWVEHDPTEIWESQLEAAKRAIADAGIRPEAIAAVGIANQRETAVLWEKGSGRPVANAIVWQCRRTAGICDALKRDGLEDKIREKTGLVVDAYFSGTKVKWLLDEEPRLRSRAGKGEVLFGTVDSWLLYNLTGGRVHATDVSNASRTLLYHLHDLEWDDEILKILGIPPEMLPSVRRSSEVLGETERGLFGRSIPIAGIAGDQHAALFGQACFSPGDAKNTYGTGCFVLMNTGREPIVSKRGLITTVAWDTGEGVEYALEGSIFIAGAAVQWLRDGIGIIASSEESEKLANSVEDTGGVYFVPAFVGLGAPHWDMYARGTIVGLTRGTGRAHIARAALEAVAYQTREVIESMEEDSGLRVPILRADGGAAANRFLLQFQADLLGRPVSRPQVLETTALGAAYLAGLATGIWKDRRAISENWIEGEGFKPERPASELERLYAGWKRAVGRATGWQTSEG